MEIQFALMLFTVLWQLMINIIAATENAVLLKDTDFQKITSSTLRWTPITARGTIPEDAVVGSKKYVPIGSSDNDLSQVNITSRSQITETKIYVCRAFVNGNWAPGALFDNTNVCIVPMVVNVQEIEPYDILQNVDQAARLIWTNWERNQNIPSGAVSAGEYYIAHSASDKLKVLSETVAIGMTYRMGRIDPQEGLFGKLAVVDEDKKLINDVPRGRVLVEHEPVMYELTIIKLTEKRKKVLRQERKILGEVILRNDNDKQMKAESKIAYKWNYDSWWGQGKAMLKGRNTTIYFTNSSEAESIMWGMPHQEEKNGVETIEMQLNEGTALHITLEANFQEIETPYVGTLLSVFADSHTMNRTIHGVWRYTTLTDKKTIYGPLYYILNNTLVPTSTTTTTTTTTTEVPTTVLTSTMVAVTEPPTLMTTKLEADEISTKLPRKDEHSNMSNDNRNALRLKEKEDTDKPGSSTSIFNASPYSAILTVGLALLMRLLFIVEPIT